MTLREQRDDAVSAALEERSVVIPESSHSECDIGGIDGRT